MSNVKHREPVELWLIRHGETAWSRSGQHTSRTDLPLTEAGVHSANALRERLKDITFNVVLSSPSIRARETGRLAGFGSQATVEPDLSEWNYGIYEGRTTAEIKAEVPGWSVWTSPVPEGESLEQVAFRANHVIEAVSNVGGRVALFSHAHILRVIGACWTNGAPSLAQHLVLSTGSISILGFEHKSRALLRWNCV